MRDWMTLHLDGWVVREGGCSVGAVREIAMSDADALAVLMYESYRGTVDDGGESLEDARGETAKLFKGDFGTLDAEACVVFEGDGALIGATIVTRDRTGYAMGEAFVAFSMTGPGWKRRGVARAGMVRVLNALKRRGEERVHLVVTRANVAAVALYQSLGFVQAFPRKTV
jgi:ribosomal protein S18 acetylase RimI-like enzyme